MSPPPKVAGDPGRPRTCMLVVNEPPVLPFELRNRMTHPTLWGELYNGLECFKR